MGSSASKVEKDDKIRACKERIGLVKQLMGFREDFANAQLAYLRSLKNIGATLRQLTDSETYVLEDSSGFDTVSLPPSPPPPPPLSPVLRKTQEFTYSGFNFIDLKVDDDDYDYENMPILPPPRIEDWDRWHSLQHSAPPTATMKNENDDKVNNGVGETSIEPEECDDHGETGATDTDTDSSLMSWYAKQKTQFTMGVGRERKSLTLAGVTKELDEYFLKASAFGTGLAVFMDTRSLGILHLEESKRKKSNSAKVFSALSWSCSSKSLHVTRESVDPSDPSRPGAHFVTLEKLYVEEQKLYRHLKQEEITKLELQRKISFLQRQQHEDPDWEHLGKAILIVEQLQSEVSFLEQSIRDASSSILKLIDVELQCQFIVLTTGLMHMRMTMYECHQIQYQLSQQLSNLTNYPCVDPISDYHSKAATQLENEARLWYDHFTEIVKSQRKFVGTFCQWLKLVNWLIDEKTQSDSLPIVSRLCDDWLLSLDSLPAEEVSEAVRGFLAAIQSIVLQHVDKQTQQRKCDKLCKRFDKELHALAEMEAKLESRTGCGETSLVDPKHPICVKRARVEALRKEADYEKTKYENLVKLSHAMTLSKLKTSLPNVFLALMEYSLACARSLEAVYDHNEPCSTDGMQQVAIT